VDEEGEDEQYKPALYPRDTRMRNPTFSVATFRWSLVYQPSIEIATTLGYANPDHSIRMMAESASWIQV
jgi:hypothetical protein